jgi:murein DD-endopeptidase MepM/ murein hydrolase activator NlpD
MGDHRAGSSGTTATADAATTTPTSITPGKRVARHAVEQRISQPYAGRRVARVAPAPAEPAAVPVPVPTPVPTPVPAPRAAPASSGYVGRRIALDPTLPTDADDVAGHLHKPSGAPSPAYVGRRCAERLLTEPAQPVTQPVTQPVARPVMDEPVPAPVLVVDPAVELALVPEEPVAPNETTSVLTREELESAPRPATEYRTRANRTGGRRVATRRTRVPSLPLLAGVAVLAVSTCGALQAVNPALAGADAGGRLSPASALSGSSAIGSANLLAGRGSVVSRDSDRQALSSASGGSLQAAADQQAEQRDATLAALRGRAEKRAAQIKLHQWVLPITPGVYHLTARFGDYSSLWAHFHTGLDFAAPTGTPIMAVAGGTITEVGYSGAYGNRTIETLPDGTELWYCHQNQFGTSVGAIVKPGQVIGYVGSTGNVTGPHLHLEVHPGGGDPVDPYAALVANGLYPGPPA